MQAKSVEMVVALVKRAQIQLPSFDGSNFRNWKAKQNNFLNPPES